MCLWCHSDVYFTAQTLRGLVCVQSPPHCSSHLLGTVAETLEQSKVGSPFLLLFVRLVPRCGLAPPSTGPSEAAHWL